MVDVLLIVLPASGHDADHVARYDWSVAFTSSTERCPLSFASTLRTAYSAEPNGQVVLDKLADVRPLVAHLDEHDRVGAACRRRKAGREQHERRHGTCRYFGATGERTANLTRTHARDQRLEKSVAGIPMKAQRVHTNVSGAKSTAWGSGLRAASAGCVASFTVTARDAEGHARRRRRGVCGCSSRDGTVASEGTWSTTRTARTSARTCRRR